MSYPAKVVANFFIEKAKAEDNQSLNLMKLLKLIYMAHGWNLAFFDKPLINEAVEAWKYGPVISAVYHSLKHNALKTIHEPIKEFSYDNDGSLIKLEYDPSFEKETNDLLENVWNTYKQYTGIQLSNWSHNPDGPWYQTWYLSGGSKSQYAGISDENIKRYFKKLGSNSGKQAA